MTDSNSLDEKFDPQVGDIGLPQEKTSEMIAEIYDRSHNFERRLLASTYLYVRLPVRPSACNSVPTGRIFMKFDISVFFQNMSEKFQFN
jgi:hypothetical protein